MLYLDEAQYSQIWFWCKHDHVNIVTSNTTLLHTL